MWKHSTDLYETVVCTVCLARFLAFYLIPRDQDGADTVVKIHPHGKQANNYLLSIIYTMASEWWCPQKCSSLGINCTNRVDYFSKHLHYLRHWKCVQAYPVARDADDQTFACCGLLNHIFLDLNFILPPLISSILNKKIFWKVYVICLQTYHCCDKPQELHFFQEFCLWYALFLNIHEQLIIYHVYWVLIHFILDCNDKNDLPLGENA